MNVRRHLPRFARGAAALLSLAVCSIFAAPQTTTRAPDEDVNSPSFRTRQSLVPSKDLLHTGWGVTPAGQHVRVSDMVLKMIVAPDKKTLVAVSGGFSDTGLTLLDLATQKVTQFLPLKESFNGVAFSRDGRRIYVAGGDLGVVHVFDYAAGKATPAPAVKPQVESRPLFLAGLAVHPGTGRVYVCNEANHEIWVLRPDTLALDGIIPVGLHPHSCLFGADQRHLYVTNWGSRTVSVVDTQTQRRVRDITVGLRPNDLALSSDGRLFVACSGDNTVHVIATRRLESLGEAASPARRLWEGTREVISTSLYPQSLEGSTPSGVAVSPDGRTLFVVNADNNNVMVVDVSNRLVEEAAARGDMLSLVNGFIPVGWYPTAVAVSPDNQTLFVANGKGLMSRESFPARTSDPRKANSLLPYDYTARIFEGHISAIARPDTAQMVAYTNQVRKNSPYTPASLTHAPIASESIIPAKVGDPCLIKHVLYIIKENRTYDQVLGDLKDRNGQPLGNGEPRLAIFGEKVTPNHHQLARDYVLLDNLYSNSEVSIDGHSWCDAAIATDFNQRSWIVSYSKHGKLPGNEEMENPANGYLWDLCRRHGVSYKNYGEGAQRVPSANRGKWGRRTNNDRDMDLVDFWIDDLRQAEKTGALPAFTIMSLGENHTSGTTPGAFTPNAAVASNDIGLGKIVAAATRSKFWKEMAIFVIEDDTQNGPDHVDAHRTVGFVISPYVKRGTVDSTLYTTASLLRTIELILGLPPLTQYDAGATPMFNSFGREAVVVPYDVLKPQIDLQERNTKKSVYWQESSKMNFKDYDRAPEDALNRILWAYAKGPDEPYPTPIHGALFTR
ncbi:MAG: bifunctional YncE family protein/alkaline phosphatase family protein [Verrucomicrobia bacterium]|nr:bifunctional YncE family protein/alkaline phosphatase family protein [Verrucomicrobiota bacterium]